MLPDASAAPRASTAADGRGPPHGEDGCTLDAAFELLERAVEDGMVPGAAAAVGTVDGTLRRGHYGYAELTPERRPLPEDALFDMASLTKIVSSTMLALRLVERGALFLNQRVATILPAFGAAGKDEITVRHLLSHTSGLPSPAAGWRPQFQRGEPHPLIWDLICRQPLRHPTGSAVLYSDVGFFTLGRLLAEAGGAPLDDLARREVFEPLGMPDTQYRPPPELRSRAAATEHLPWRGGTVVGAVHDEMTAASGGVAGHAGLFSTCRDLERFCRLWLGGGQLAGQRLLSAAGVAAATRDQTEDGHDVNGRPARFGLGWMLQPNPRWMGAELCSPRAYGHTGFTGTSLLVDPGNEIWAVLLTNRVHPSREAGSLERVSALRARFHNAALVALSSL